MFPDDLIQLLKSFSRLFSTIEFSNILIIIYVEVLF